MSIIKPISIEQATGSAKEQLSAIKNKLGGMLPNVYAVMANSPATLSGCLAFTESLSKGKLSPKHRELIAIAVASKNSCEYCLSAHTMIGKSAGVDSKELTLAQSGKSSDPKAQAILDLALEINWSHGKAATSATARARTAGLSDEEILETAACVALNVLTNSVNGLAGTDIDFPKVEISNAA